MISFTCPNCGTRLSLPDSSAGTAVVCGACHQRIAVAAAVTEPELPQIAASTAIHVSARPAARRKRRTNWLNPLVHIGISCTALVAIIGIYNQKRQAQTPTQVVRVEPKPKPRPAIIRSQPQAPTLPPVTPEPEPEPAVEPPPRVDPFADWPAFVDLPSHEDTTLAVLVGKPLEGAALALVSNTEGLQLADSRITFKGRTVAGLRLSDSGLIEFRWLAGVPPESIPAVVNSVVRITAGEDSHALALRSPQKIEAEPLELNATVLRIKCECDHPPAAEHIRFDLVTAHLPSLKPEAEPTGLKPGAEVIMPYAIAADAATKVSMRSLNGMALAEVASQYRLPSGDVEVLTVSRGNRKLKQLERYYQDCLDAQASIGQLQSYRKGLDSDLRRAQGMRTMLNSNVENPVWVAQKAAAITAVQREMVATDRSIERARQLIADRPSVETDLAAIRVVAELAQSLVGTELAYRFYTVVDGHRVDLLVAE